MTPLEAMKLKVLKDHYGPMVAGDALRSFVADLNTLLDCGPQDPAFERFYNTTKDLAIYCRSQGAKEGFCDAPVIFAVFFKGRQLDEEIDIMGVLHDYDTSGEPLPSGVADNHWNGTLRIFKPRGASHLAELLVDLDKLHITYYLIPGELI